MQLPSIAAFAPLKKSKGRRRPRVQVSLKVPRLHRQSPAVPFFPVNKIMPSQPRVFKVFDSSPTCAS
ncbi:hypothetical protein NXS19_007612 [Fusarium pseudograminearum]|nr:hypothetical protein NXS19_007612 [Fusarium pseudograminearum]